MKQELLEYLVRHCVREVLSQVNEVDEPTQGAAAPPEDGQGTADQPEIPKDPSPADEKPSEPETPPPSADLRGVVLVNPKDKSKIERIAIRATDDASIERELHRTGAQRAGSKVKVALSTVRMVKDAMKNPNTTTYLYLGKYDPASDEIFLMADKSLQVAKDSSVSPAELTGTPVSTLPPQDFNPSTASAQDFGKRMAAQGQASPAYGIDEKFQKMIKQAVNEILDKK